MRTLLAVIIVLAITSSAAAQDDDPKYATYYQQETAVLPGHAVQLIDGSNLRAFIIPKGVDGSGEVVNVDGQPFGEAVRVKVLHAVQPVWNVQLVTPHSLAQVKKGDTLFVEYHVRCTQSAGENGGGHFTACLQFTREPWTGTGSFTGTPGSKWFKGYDSFIASQDYAPGELEMTFHLGQQAQTLEIGGLIVVDLGPKVDFSRLPVTRITYAGREADAPWRKEAEARIDKYRKGDLTVLVTDAAGKAAPGVPVHVQMTRHAYQFGTFLESPTEWHNADGQKYRDYVLKWFNRVTVPVYWADWGWPRAKAEYLARAQWAADHGLHVRGHNIVWPAWKNMPTALHDDAKDPAKLRQAIDAHVDDIATSFRQFKFDDYDVVNEVRDNHDVQDILGPSVLVDWFKKVRQIDLKPHLGINEYDIIAGGGWTTAQQDAYEKTIRYLLDQGAPLGVIGMQCHFGEDLTPPARVVEILDRFAKFHLPLQATEFDVNTADEEAQADYLRDFYTVFFSHPATEAITMWGFWQGQQWIPRAALIRTDWTLKPNGRAYQELVFGKWWTDVEGKTGADGTITIRGFRGDYLITAQAPAGEVHATVNLGLKQANSVG